MQMRKLTVKTAIATFVSFRNVEIYSRFKPIAENPLKLIAVC